MNFKCDAVFEGGGVKGIALAGAFSVMEAAGYQFINLAGSSAGAIVSALIAVGYTSDEIRQELNKLDYNRFKQEDLLDKFGSLGKAFSIGINFGIYNADYFENWLQNLLERKGKTKFKDILTGYENPQYRYRFNAIASDLTDKKMLILPEALHGFGFDPDEYSIAKAVRMSMSIPIFFEPFRLLDNNQKEHIIVDGGLLSNYPIWLLDDGTENPEWPTIGFKFADNLHHEKNSIGQQKQIRNIVDYAVSIIKTLTDAHDSFHISQTRGDLDRTILIPIEVTQGKGRNYISATDFDITQAESDELYQNGRTAAEKFLHKWDFEAWKNKYRKHPTTVSITTKFG